MSGAVSVKDDAIPGLLGTGALVWSEQWQQFAVLTYWHHGWFGFLLKESAHEALTDGDTSLVLHSPEHPYASANGMRAAEAALNAWMGSERLDFKRDVPGAVALYLTRPELRRGPNAPENLRDAIEAAAEAGATDNRPMHKDGSRCGFATEVECGRAHVAWAGGRRFPTHGDAEAGGAQ